MDSLPEDMKRDVVEFQQLQQQLQMVAMQRQQSSLALAELAKAGEEVAKSSGKCYRFAGSVMVPKEKAALEAELKEEKESLDLRQGMFQKQEDKLRERLSTLQKKFAEFSTKQQKPSGKEAA
ncbi:TPA: prefoldin subunit beta [Candidatus Micrarchaeota archaeon]|nr:MAG: prefoldin subunit beta [Candidatus Micrarchaeota archaeon CG1_02_51_15]HII39286.1 prefoldin subunit beta [Candidatus Micrarchaeota archaeon]